MVVLVVILGKRRLELLKEHFFWPSILRNMHKVIERCAICKKAKGKENAYGLYRRIQLKMENPHPINIDL